MKSAELIRQLQAADPDGDTEVCIDNADIHFVAPMAAFWDGRLEILIRDPDCKYYNIIGAKRTSKGGKIKIHPLSIEDALLNDPDMPIDNSEVGSEAARREYDNVDADHRAEFRKIIDDAEEWTRNHKAKQAAALNPELE